MCFLRTHAAGALSHAQVLALLQAQYDPAELCADVASRVGLTGAQAVAQCCQIQLAAAATHQAQANPPFCHAVVGQIAPTDLPGHLRQLAAASAGSSHEDALWLLQAAAAKLMHGFSALRSALGAQAGSHMDPVDAYMSMHGAAIHTAVARLAQSVLHAEPAGHLPARSMAPGPAVPREPVALAEGCPEPRDPAIIFVDTAQACRCGDAHPSMPQSSAAQPRAVVPTCRTVYGSLPVMHAPLWRGATCCAGPVAESSGWQEWGSGWQSGVAAGAPSAADAWDQSWDAGAAAPAPAAAGTREAAPDAWSGWGADDRDNGWSPAPVAASAAARAPRDAAHGDSAASAQRSALPAARNALADSVSSPAQQTSPASKAPDAAAGGTAPDHGAGHAAAAQPPVVTLAQSTTHGAAADQAAAVTAEAKKRKKKIVKKVVKKKTTPKPQQADAQSLPREAGSCPTAAASQQPGTAALDDLAGATCAEGRHGQEQPGRVEEGGSTSVLQSPAGSSPPRGAAAHPADGPDASRAGSAAAACALQFEMPAHAVAEAPTTAEDEPEAAASSKTPAEASDIQPVAAIDFVDASGPREALDEGHRCEARLGSERAQLATSEWLDGTHNRPDASAAAVDAEASQPDALASNGAALTRITGFIKLNCHRMPACSPRFCTV
jgi:hypothetical protein